MLIDTTFAVVLFCADCGRMHLEEVSAFSLYRKTKNIICACGKHLGCLRALGSDRYMLSLGAIEQGVHAVRFSRNILDTNKVYPFPSMCCREEGGFVGSLQAVCNELEFTEKETAHSIDFPDCIDAPEVMFEVINKVDDLAISGSICCGNCGHSEIGLEIFGSFILLYCSHCGNMYEIRAKYQEDAKYIRKINFIELQPINEI